MHSVSVARYGNGYDIVDDEATLVRAAQAEPAAL